MRTVDDFPIGSVWTYTDTFGTWPVLIVEKSKLSRGKINFMTTVELCHGTTWPIIEGSRTIESMKRVA